MPQTVWIKVLIAIITLIAVAQNRHRGAPLHPDQGEHRMGKVQVIVEILFIDDLFSDVAPEVTEKTNNWDNCKILYFENFNLENIIMPVDAEKFNSLLLDANCCYEKGNSSTKALTMVLVYCNTEKVQIT